MWNICKGNFADVVGEHIKEGWLSMKAKLALVM